MVIYSAFSRSASCSESREVNISSVLVCVTSDEVEFLLLVSSDDELTVSVTCVVVFSCAEAS